MAHHLRVKLVNCHEIVKLQLKKMLNGNIYQMKWAKIWLLANKFII
jgi:hypothetical protein